MNKIKSIALITFVSLFITSLSYGQQTEEKAAKPEEAALAKAT